MADLTEDVEKMVTDDLARHLGQVSLDSSSPSLPSREQRSTTKFSLRDLEIMQTIGEWNGKSLSLINMSSVTPTTTTVLAPSAAVASRLTYCAEQRSI